jgi:O-antigen/teichoic acid export membrane protein
MGPTSRKSQFDGASPTIQSTGAWRELVSASGTLTVGNFVAGLAGIGWLAIMTRALDLNSVGIFASVLALAGLAERVVAFGTWQAVIHFGSKDQGTGPSGRLVTLLRLGWVLDTSTSVVASLTALLAVSLIPDSVIDFGADDRIKFVLLLPLILGAHSSSMGFLRLHNKYRLQAIATIVGPVLSLCMFAFLYYSGAEDLLTYALAWAIGTGITRIAIILGAIKVRREYRSYFNSAPSIWEYFKSTPKLGRFLVTTHADGIIRAIRDVDILVINSLLGAEATGLYKVGRTVASVFGRLTGPFHQAILPIFSRLSRSRGRTEANSIARKSSALLGFAMLFGWFLFALTGEAILISTFGPGYRDSYLPTLFLLLSMVIWGFSQTLSPMLVAAGRVGTSSLIHAATVAIYISSLYFLTPNFGILGAAIALVLFYSLWSLGSLVAVLISLRKSSNGAGRFIS